MITIITGVPGMGKTSLMVSMLIKEVEKGDRPIFVMGVDNLQLEHQKLPPIEEWTYVKKDKDDPTVELHYFTFPPNSLLIIDEAQKIYRPRSTSAKVPPIVSALETHRHTGIDIWLLTQKPSLLDSNVRDLCGRHMHIRNSILGRKIYEWSEYKDVKIEANFKDAASRFFKPPKQAFNLYKSAEVHTKQPRRIHNAFIVLGIAVPLLLYQIYTIYTKYTSKINQTDKPVIGTLDRLESEIKTEKNDNSEISKADLKNDNFKQSETIEPIHPFKGFEFTIKGTIKSSKLNATYYEITNGNKSIFINDTDLKNLGYSITQLNDCSSFIFFNGTQITATCERQATSSTRSVQVSRVSEQIGGIGGVAPDVDGFNIDTHTLGITSRLSPSNP